MITRMSRFQLPICRNQIWDSNKMYFLVMANWLAVVGDYTLGYTPTSQSGWLGSDPLKWRDSGPGGRAAAPDLKCPLQCSGPIANYTTSLPDISWSFHLDAGSCQATHIEAIRDSRARQLSLVPPGFPWDGNNGTKIETSCIQGCIGPTITGPITCVPHRSRNTALRIKGPGMSALMRAPTALMCNSSAYLTRNISATLATRSQKDSENSGV